jgi:hypothetical protein
VKRAVALLLAAIAVIVALTLARPHGPPGAPLRDFEAYYAAGDAWAHGADPYGTAIWQYEKTLPGVNARRYELLPFVGPPATLPLWAAFARLPYAAAAIAWRAILLLAILALVWLGLLLSGARRTSCNLLAAAIAALGFGAITNAFSLGQIALPVAAAVAAAYAATRFGGKVLAATAAFAQPNLALALGGEFRRKDTAIAIACAVALFGLLCAGINVNAIFTYAQVLIAHGASEQFSAIQLTPAAIVYGFGASGTAALWIGSAVALATMLLWLGAMIKFEARLTLFAISCAILPFGSAFFHQHDLVIEFVPAVVLAARAPAAVLPAALGGALLCATNWIGIAQHPDAALQTALLAAAFALALLALRDDLTLRACAVPATVIVLIVLGGIVARAHAMPVWPDAMQPLSLQFSGQSAAQVWHAEQLATGLFARDTMWALLRSASLAGCALLVYAAAVSPKCLVDSKTFAAGQDRVR